MQGDRTDKRDTSAFNTWKDLIIPGNVDDGMTTQGARFVEPLPLSERKHLANFFGRPQGKIGRLQLIDLSKQFPDKVDFLHGYMFECLAQCYIWTLINSCGLTFFLNIAIAINVLFIRKFYIHTLCPKKLTTYYELSR